MTAHKRRALLAGLLAILAGTFALMIFRASPQAVASTDSLRPPEGAALTVLYRARARNAAQSTAEAWDALGDPLRSRPAAWAAVSAASDAAWLRSLAGTAIDLADWPLAQAALERLVSLDTHDADARWQLGLLLAAASPEAARLQLEAAARDPAHAALAATLTTAIGQSAEAVGWALFGASLWPQAELAFTRAAADPGLSAAALGALALSRDYQAKDGSIWMERALARAPESAEVRAILGIHLRLRGDDAGSLAALQAAAALAPANAPILAQLGAAWQRAGQFAEARRWYELAQSLAGDDPRYQALVDAIARTQDLTLDALPGIPPVGAP